MSRIYYMAGVWDLFHVGHLRAIQRARRIVGGEKLILGVVTDEHAYKYKKVYPIIPYWQRCEIVEALSLADKVVGQYVQFSLGHMQGLGVGTVLLGADWKERRPLHLQKMEKEIEVIYLPRTADVSSSDIKNKILGKSV